MPPPFIRQVTIRNYKSIAACTVDLRQLMFVVGPNGAGKSNFLDAFRFVADALRTSLDHALRDRGTIKEVRRRSGGHPNSFSLGLDFALPTGQTGHYEFQVAARTPGGYEVQSEFCQLEPIQALARPQFYRIEAGRVVDSSVATLPAVLPDRLLLVAASGLPEFRPVFDVLSRMEIYNLNPREIASMQRPDPGDILRRDGSNAASVLQQLPKSIRERINAHVGQIVPGVSDATPRTLGSQETIEFRQAVQPDLLDNRDIPPDALLVADADAGITEIGPIDAAGREMLRKRLFTPGELLRQNQLARDRRADRDPVRAGSAELFGNGAA